MALRLYVATTSQGKLRDFRVAAEAHSIDIDPLPGLATIPAPEENGATFADNARLKAIYYSRFAPDALVMADDSGLEVDALDGAPGVRSARFAGEHATDGENLARLLSELDGSGDRRVAYVAQLVAIDPEGRELLARGELRGSLAQEPRGSGGFGYDPAFVPEGETRTVGEMSAAEKDGISHRARAAAELLPLLP